MFWEMTLNNVYPTYTNLQKIIIIIILHKCKKSRDVDIVLIIKSTQLEFVKKNIEGKSIMNPIHEDDIENELQ
jgi:hypothetical protein